MGIKPISIAVVARTSVAARPGLPSQPAAPVVSDKSDKSDSQTRTWPSPPVVNGQSQVTCRIIDTQV